MSPPPARMKSTPELPGPPGLKNSDPIRFPGPLAICRMTARWILRPSGRDQSRGTRTRAHCRPSPHGFQAIRVVISAEERVATGESRVAAPAPSAVAKQMRSKAKGTTVLRVSVDRDKVGQPSAQGRWWLCRHERFDAAPSSGDVSCHAEGRGFES